MQPVEALRRKPGRPLSFDRGRALERAMLVFWRHGFEATSIAMLTEALGITAPSLYAAFGDKKRLFVEAARLYAGAPDDLAARLSAAPTARDAARDLMRDAAARFTGATTPPGCLLASATAAVSAGVRDMAAEVTAIRTRTRTALAQRIAMEIDTGLLPPSADADRLAAAVVGMIQGMSALARDGADRQTLVGIATVLLDGWPEPAKRDVGR